ncbi:Stage III sporulation protein AH [Paraliobacillus sp. PM-2]|uniref:SpoIIIAH-like family protein n=1 Tax=Paraliobacillus sp. PM-2 TaxID=1462524 RepID=UPI00061C5DC5|nr:SpoIIIAH-like family protein [Paraliobacillus sp. PM-2]CQR46790.1 Stage III sporulation protein AH [Paraliobacillus sp. PM-2]
MLKKQTVWLLTMLSLMIVLSVYYMNSNADGDFAFINEEITNEETTTGNVDEGAVENESEGNVDIVNQNTDGSDELFTMIRMDLAETRSNRMEQLREIIASSSTSTEEKNEAYDEMEEIDHISSKELIIEETLKSENNYSDVLVRTKDNSVIVTVNAQELSDVEANNIMQMVYDEFGRVNVEVKFKPED